MKLVINAEELLDKLQNIIDDNYVSCMLTIKTDDYGVEPIKVDAIGLDESDTQSYGEISCEEVSM